MFSKKVHVWIVVALGLTVSGMLWGASEDEGWVFISNMIGDDTTGDGSRAQPFETVGKALTVGQKIRFLPNNPMAPYPKITLVGTPDDFLYEFESEAGPSVTQLRGFESAGDVRYVITGFTITNPDGDGILMGDFDEGEVRNCVIAHCLYRGINALADQLSLTVTNAVFYGNLSWGLNAHGTGATSTSVVRNVIATRNGNGISGSGSSSGRLLYSCVLENTGANVNYSVMFYPVTEGLAFVNPDECNFQLRRPGDGSPGLFHQGDPGLKNPDGTRSDLGAYGGPYCQRWFQRHGGTRPVVSSVTTDRSPAPDGKLRVQVRVKVQ